MRARARAYTYTFARQDRVHPPLVRKVGQDNRLDKPSAPTRRPPLNVHLNRLPSLLSFVHRRLLSLLLFLSEFPFLNSWTNRVYKRVKRTKEESPGFSVKIGRNRIFLNPVLRSIVARSKSIDLDVYKKRRSVPRWLSLWRNVYNTKFQP